MQPATPRYEEGRRPVWSALHPRGAGIRLRSLHPAAGAVGRPRCGSRTSGADIGSSRLDCMTHSSSRPRIRQSLWNGANSSSGPHSVVRGQPLHLLGRRTTGGRRARRSPHCPPAGRAASSHAATGPRRPGGRRPRPVEAISPLAGPAAATARVEADSKLRPANSFRCLAQPCPPRQITLRHRPHGGSASTPAQRPVTGGAP